MMKKRHILHWAIGVILTPLLGSCTTDDAIGGAGREECDIMSGQPMTVTSATKANDGRTLSTQFEKDEIVWLWANKTDDTEYIKAWQLTAKSGGNLTGTNTNKYWPSDGKSLNVYALHGNFKNSPSISEGTTRWSKLSLTHTVETNQTSANKKRLSDLLYSHPTKSFAPNPGSVQLTFDHLLAKITVKLDLDESKGIESSELNNATVTLTNILPDATFKSSTGAAASAGGTRTTISAGKITSSISSGDVIGSAIVPLQQFGGRKSDSSPDNVITITLASPDNRSFSYKSETNVALSAGMEYTYTLRIIGNKITGSLSVSPFLSEGDKSISFTDYFDYLADLKNRAYLGSSSAPHDLSYDYNGQMNTANCYVVTHPGYYKFPLVYGNAIKNGATNAIAYGVKDGTRISSTFVNHLDRQITDPYIYNNENCTVYSAELVWQDAQNLIRKIALCDNNKYISFEITKENIEQGNAVIAVKHTDGTIMWSWHIWVTNKNVYETVPVLNQTGITYYSMPVPLGWDDDIAEQPNCTFYQWGRKDPMCPSDGTIEKHDKNIFDSDNNPLNMRIEEGGVTTNISIQKPDVFFTSPDKKDWNNTTYYDFWNSTNNTLTTMNDNEVLKTIYDPSPVRFKMPAPNAYTGFRNGNTGYVPLYEGSWDAGYYFKTGLINPSSIFFRANGYRSYLDGSLMAVTKQGLYWLSGAQTEEKAYHLLFQDKNVAPAYYNLRSNGFPVCPVSE